MIQSHAMRLFIEHGYDATTVNQVAKAAGVSPMTVYRTSRPRKTWCSSTSTTPSSRPGRCPADR